MTQVTSPVLFPPLLLATDGSPSARVAQKLLASIAQVFQTEGPSTGQALVTVLTVQPRRSSRSSKPNQPSLAEAASSSAEATSPTASVNPSPTHAERQIEPDRLMASIQAEFPADLAVDLQVRRGRPATEILNYARAIQAGLIAVGQQGAGGVRELLLGSVSSVIARYAPCSVLVARGTSTAEPNLNHVLLVVEGTPASRTAIALTRQLVPAGVQRITLLCTQLPPNTNYLFGPFVTPTPSWQLSQSLQSAQREQGEHLLQQARKALNLPNLEIEMRLQTGEPGPQICEVAQEQQANLIVIGTGGRRRSLPTPWHPFRRSKQQASGQAHARRTLRNTRLSGSEDYIIHHAPCPVLLCRVEVNS